MARTLKLRAPTDEERREVERLARARSAPARLVERARVVVAWREGERAEATAARFPVTATTVYLWLHRCHAHRTIGVEDCPRTGRRPSSSREQVATNIAPART
jgi:transposase